ncbi:2Fe-2S iron-sulfur cluster-binding protein [Labilibacter marinus]|uniref:2Fe-2S iron-sulfur cluster-binding protein n=1 Tax=Labilibacter marinus TaxID=1477105 RepID=UPI00082ACA57|nr:2Fe-2S iron-sulfur cluster-binding protein [Labilibacter marinus]
MAKITFVTRDNEHITLEASSGSLMKLATQNGIKGIEGECGGVCSCATCHVHVPEEHSAKTGEASEIEKDLLELSDNVQDNSRLCCQVQITEELDGLVVHVAN